MKNAILNADHIKHLKRQKVLELFNTMLGKEPKDPIQKIDDNF